ncbi:MAG: hypothetical protein AAF298_08725 [Cyanobacteria bacterium P01_A01_bin.40]
MQDLKTNDLMPTAIRFIDLVGNILFEKSIIYPGYILPTLQRLIGKIKIGVSI